jgi:hypothetical protein
MILTQRTLHVVVVGLILPALVSAADKPGRPASVPSWNLKYKSGSFQLTKEQWLQSTFVTDLGQMKETGTIIAIRRDALRAIYFDATAEKDSDMMQRMQRSGCAYAESRMPVADPSPPPGALVVRRSSRGAFSRATEHLNSRYQVRIVWSDEGVDKELVITANHCEYASFVANLRRFAGERWQEIGHEFPR